MADAQPRWGDTAVAGSWGASFFTDFAHALIYNATRDEDLWTNPTTGKRWMPQDVLGTGSLAVGETILQMRARGFWPVYEGKNTDLLVVGGRAIRYWLSLERAKSKYNKELPTSLRAVVYRQTASNTNERTWLGVALPACSAATNTLTGVTFSHVEAEGAATVMASFVFDFALRLRVSSHVSLTNLLPMPVPPADVANRLPRVPTQFAWEKGIRHITDDKDLWLLLWEANRAVAEAYGLSPDDVDHVLASFPVFARKRPAFFAYLQERLAEWQAKG
jgi:hypothetical protein